MFGSLMYSFDLSFIIGTFFRSCKHIKYAFVFLQTVGIFCLFLYRLHKCVHFFYVWVFLNLFSVSFHAGSSFFRIILPPLVFRHIDLYSCTPLPMDDSFFANNLAASLWDS